MMIWKSIKRARRRGTGTIIAHYEPPRGIKPAEAEYFLNGHNSYRAFSATIIDLAERGYARIEEREPTESEAKIVRTSKIFERVIAGIFAGMLGMFTLSALTGVLFSQGATGLFILIPAAITGLISFKIIKAVFNKDRKPGGFVFYVVKRTDKKEGPDVSRYEKFLMDTIFFGGDFDMSATRNSERAMNIAKSMPVADKIMAKDFDEGGRLVLKRSVAIKTASIILWLAVFAAIPFILPVFVFAPFFTALAEGLAITVAILISGRRYTAEGKTLWEELLGFKLYIETADKYRLQNLTPDLFGKYLAYAMVFGLEKEWASAFEGMNVSSPSWYSGSLLSSAQGGTAPGFSSAAFTAGFSASFSSMFASATGTSSSGGGGGSGGGGSSGGGGGGGGGGAS
jgi:uncharacterized membrane protein YgcG